VQGKLSSGGHERRLWNCVNRYAKRTPTGEKGLTLFLAHGNGFPKEVPICFMPKSFPEAFTDCDTDVGSMSATFISFTFGFAD